VHSQDFKPLYLAYACKDLLKSCYTKSDVKSIGRYASSFPTHRALDAERTRMKPKIDAVFNQLKKCVNEDQMRSILKSQPTDIKFFIFERFAVTIAFMDRYNIEGVEVESSKPVGLAFTETIERFWQIVHNSMDEFGNSLSQLSFDMIQSQGQ